MLLRKGKDLTLCSNIYIICGTGQKGARPRYVPLKLQTLRIILILILTIVCFNITINGQIYSGASDNNDQILFQINKDSSIKFIYYQELGIYAEHIGYIQKINDSVYHISATMSFANYLTLTLYTYDTVTGVTNDTDYFHISRPFISQDDTVIIKYANGQTRNYIPYDNQGNEVNFVLDKKLLNDKPKSNYYTVIFKRKNEITGQPLTFILGQHTGMSYLSGIKLDFDVIIKNNNLWSKNGYELPTGHFKLKKKSGT